MYELVYTSTPQGLLTGRSGFTTVALTEGFPPNLIALIENLSGYKTLFEHGSEHEPCNPVNFSCQPLHLGRTSYMVLSRISYAGISYTGRSNVLAHHLIFPQEELEEIPGGAIAVLRAEENFPEWNGKPRMLQLKRRIGSRMLPDKAEMWEKLAGSSQWARYTAECFRANPGKGLVLAFDPLRISGSDILELIAETAAHLPQKELRHFTFSTYCYSSGITNPLFFRSYVNDSAILGSIRRLEPDSIIDLGTRNPLPQAWDEDASSLRESDRHGPEDDFTEDPAPLPVDQSMDPADSSQQDTGLPSGPSDPAQFSIPPFESPITASAETRGEHSQDGVKIKRRIAAVLIAVLALGLCAAVFWRIFTNQPMQDPANYDFLPKKNKSQENRGSPLRKTKSESKARPDINQQNTGRRTPPSKKTASKNRPDRPADSDIRLTAAKKPEPPVSAAPTLFFSKPTGQEHLDLYRHFRKGGKHKLPESLRDTAALKVKLRSVGGLDKIGDLQRFISGDKSKRVEIYARLPNNTGFQRDWDPDKSNIKSKMIFQLIPEDDSLEIIFPPETLENAPQLADVSQITFICRDGGKEYRFDPNQLPSGMTEFLNQEKVITVQYDNDDIRFHMKISDDLWANRMFYSISVNDQNKGDISEHDISLWNVHLNGVKSELIHRNKLVKQFYKLQKEKENFKKDNQQDLTTPKLGNKLLEQMFAGKKSFHALLTAASNENDQNWDKRVNEIKDQLNQIIMNRIPQPKQQELTEELKAATADLNHFRQQCLNKRQLAEFRQNIADCQAKIKNHNESLLKKLKDLPSALYHAASKTLEKSKNPEILDSNFYRKIPEQELKKDIRVEIIRKGPL